MGSIFSFLRMGDLPGDTATSTVLSLPASSCSQMSRSVIREKCVWLKGDVVLTGVMMMIGTNVTRLTESMASAAQQKLGIRPAGASGKSGSPAKCLEMEHKGSVSRGTVADRGPVRDKDRFAESKLVNQR